MNVRIGVLFGLGAAACAAIAFAAVGPETAAVPDPKKPDRASLDKIPESYRDWRLISVAREEGDINDIRAILGNDIAIKAYREGKKDFPDGAIIARLAWNLVASEENNKAFGRAQSFVAGAPKNGVQFMIKDSKKFAATGGWRFSQFDDAKPLTDETKLRACFECHARITDRDIVFTRYAP